MDEYLNMKIEQIIAINFNSLKETIGLNTLGLKSNHLYVVKIPIKDKFYYLISNSKMEIIEIQLKNELKPVRTNSKIFVTSIEPISVSVAAGSGYSSFSEKVPSVLTLDEVSNDLNDLKFFPFEFKEAIQSEVDKYFINDHIIDEEKIDKYLFRIPVTEKQEVYLSNNEAENKLSINEEISRSLIRTIFKDGYIYTNNYLNTIAALKKLDRLIRNTPQLDSKKIFSEIRTKLSSIEQRAFRIKDVESMEQINKQLSQFIAKL